MTIECESGEEKLELPNQMVQEGMKYSFMLDFKLNKLDNFSRVLTERIEIISKFVDRKKCYKRNKIQL